MLHNIALAGKSTVVIRSIPLLMNNPSGVSTSIPVEQICDVDTSACAFKDSRK